MTTPGGGGSELTVGEPGTFEWLWHQVQPTVLRLARRMLPLSPAQAQEVTQETGLLLWLTIEVEHKLVMPQDQAELAGIKRWACRAAHYGCLDLRRRQRREAVAREAVARESTKPEPVTREHMQKRMEARQLLALLNLTTEQVELLLGTRKEAADDRTRQQVKRLRDRLKKRLLDAGYEMDGESHGT